ncbi:uncharacterized protein EI97DRAFT_457119 [Westerdykella ornata]|uniref:Uncharacterized protein n=1 Tax=Westerdykella ornata TaxID=318751 RepID=A0A6A6JMJ9_WESOR|nr:uncharacterized protein EI97DRAFT_457119 [Westerdykella ornata]KAF2277880.1 hypothetical protein EI97DRAFT_457119 [Westerdykella ornata]
MAAAAQPQGPIALVSAPDGDLACRDAANHPSMQAMQLDLPTDLLDELLDTARNGKITVVFGRTPHLRFGDKTHPLQTSPERYRHELYQPTSSASDRDLEFAGLISHSLAVQKAEETTAGVDVALEQLKSSMAAISEFKEANKTIVGDATPIHTPGHRRFPSKGFKPAHLAPSSTASPLLSAPPSPMVKPPTSQPTDSHDLLLRALRVPLIHLLAIQPATDTYLAETCRTTVANVRELLNKLARQSSERWQLTDKAYRELNPWKFAYKNPEDRERAINNAIKSFDRLRLAKDDKLWQILLPVEERGQGKCLSQLNIKAPDPKPATPLQKMPKLNDKKPAASKKRTEEKESAREVKRSKEPRHPAEVKVKNAVREKPPSRTIREAGRPNADSSSSPSPSNSSAALRPKPTPNLSSNSPAINHPTAPAHPQTPSTDTMAPIIRQRKVLVPVKKDDAGKPTATPPVTSTKPKERTPQVSKLKEQAGQSTKPKEPPAQTSKAKEQPTQKPTKLHKPNKGPEQSARKSFVARPTRPAVPVNTKPKNPSPLSASPPINASDFERNHPVHKALSGTPSPAKTSSSSSSSDRPLKRKADDAEGEARNNLSVKHARVERPTPADTPTSMNSRGAASSTGSANSLKRKSDDSSAANTPTNKIRKVTNIDTSRVSQHPVHNNNNQLSPADSSSTATSPAEPLSFRRTVELSQKFQQYYKKYEELYWSLAESSTPPTEAQRSELMKMHQSLEAMKREIKAGCGATR